MDEEAVKTTDNWLFDRRCSTVDDIQCDYESELYLIEWIESKTVPTLVVYTTFGVPNRYWKSAQHSVMNNHLLLPFNVLCSTKEIYPNCCHNTYTLVQCKINVIFIFS